MPTQGLLELAERCEAATGPDRSLNAKIALAVLPQFSGWIEHPANNGNQYGEMAPSREAFDEWLIHDGEPCLVAAPNYTASLDAAMTLVPEGWQVGDLGENWRAGGWRVTLAERPTEGQKRAYNVGKTYMVQSEQGEAATPALALTAACLRAKARGDSGMGM